MWALVKFQNILIYTLWERPKKIQIHKGLAISVMKKRTCQHNNQCWEVFTCWNLEPTCKGRVGCVYMDIPLNDNFKIKELLWPLIGGFERIIELDLTGRGWRFYLKYEYFSGIFMTIVDCSKFSETWNQKFL